jgi:type I restriction enzyme S subunit
VPENDKYYLAPNVARIRFGELVYPKYASQLMGSERFYIKIITPLIATSSQPALSMENVRKFKLDIPKFDEQIKIGDFFEKIDNLITLHQHKHDQLENLKKGYMQRLFA